MNIEPMYLTILLIAGGIILLVLFFHYVPFFLWAIGQSIRSKHLIGTTFSSCVSVMFRRISLCRA